MFSREIDGDVHTFGTTGYTRNNVFVLYDRNSDSIWHPLDEGTLDAVAGARKGRQLSFVSEPDPVPLAEWLAEHPQSLVMLPTAEEAAVMNRGFLGVRLDLAVSVTVAEVIEGSGAAAAGIQVGDRIVRVDGTRIPDRAAFLDVLRDTRPGDRLEVAVLRDGQKIQLDVTLGARRGE